jgi:signal transduction histidine kinase
MVLQVGAVRHRMPPDRESDRQALQDVEHVGRAALGEVRRLLGALAGESDAELAPQPGLDQLEALVDKVRGTGLAVVVHVEGEPVELPRALDLSAYRIIQEGLTNVLKHASATRADVRVMYGRDDLTVEVRDDGSGSSGGDRAGRGLVGVGERVKIYGGSMSAGQAPEGGFVLTARLSISQVDA